MFNILWNFLRPSHNLNINNDSIKIYSYRHNDVQSLFLHKWLQILSSFRDRKTISYPPIVCAYVGYLWSSGQNAHTAM
jgi:hypothetical protein